MLLLNISSPLCPYVARSTIATPIVFYTTDPPTHQLHCGPEEVASPGTGLICAIADALPAVYFIGIHVYSL